MIYDRSEFKGVSMLSLFGMEVSEQVIALNDNLLAIESQTAEESENASGNSHKAGNGSRLKRLEALMRAVHSMKGGARIVGLDAAVAVAHAMEECFVAAKNDQLALNAQTVDVLLAGVDWFTQLGQVENEAHVQWLSQQQDNTQQLVDALSKLIFEPGLPLSPEPFHPESLSGSSSPVPSSSPAPFSVKPFSPASSALAPTSPDPSSASPAVNPASLAPASPDPLPAESGRALPFQPSVVHPAVTPSAEVTAQASDNLFSTSHAVKDNSTRVVKINADNLNQLMALAGESLVEANWLQPFANTLQQLKQHQQSLTGLLDQLQQTASLAPAEKSILDEAQKTAIGCYGLLSDRIGELDRFSRRFSQLSDNLYREVIASHMRPFADATQGFSRMVRDLARGEGKQITLEILGENTPIDRDILDRLEAPLTHMLRNAIAHGIELPERRQALGKPTEGTIRIEASHRAGMLSITVTDDGAGLDIEQLRQSVCEKQLASAELAAHLSETELLEFLFLPGFSTAQQVTEIAGRGVGLDIAKTMTQAVGGLLRTFNHPGAGLTFHFQLPLTLSVLRGLVVEIAGEPYAFGLTRIEQVLFVRPEEIALSENRPYMVVGNENISLIKAQEVLELPEAKEVESTHLPVIILKDQGPRYGIIVDKFLGERELVVRPLDERFGKVQDVSAAALTEDGLPLLIIDVADLVRTIEQLVSHGTLTMMRESPQAAVSLQDRKKKRVLVVDDSLTVRETERQLLTNRGYHVDVAVNGMEGWNTVRTGNYDLVVSDIDMPRMNGIELVEHIKSHPKLNQLPVIIVSYKDRQADKLAGLNAGANYYLTKSSFQDNSLLTAVVDLIGLS